MTQNSNDSSEELFKLRATKEEDLSYLLLMSEGQEIGIPPNYMDGGCSAVNWQDIPVGYIHVEPTEKGAHIGPIVVFEDWQGYDIGTALINWAHEKYGILKLVSNGSSNGFYDKLGFVEVDWDEIDERFHRDCLTCPYYEQCGPKPYMLT